MNGPRKLISLLAFAVAFALGLGFAPTADAGCAGQCVNRPQPGKPFCLKCETASTETGALCQQQGPCSCFYIQCAFAASTSNGAVNPASASCTLGEVEAATAATESLQLLDFSAPEPALSSAF